MPALSHTRNERAPRARRESRSLIRRRLRQNSRRRSSRIPGLGPLNASEISSAEKVVTHDSLVTIAEKSAYRETGRIDEVEALCDEFARAWPDAVRPLDYGRSAEGRILRALLVSQ